MGREDYSVCPQARSINDIGRTIQTVKNTRYFSSTCSRRLNETVIAAKCIRATGDESVLHHESIQKRADSKSKYIYPKQN